MSKMFQLYGVGQATFSVLPPPIAFANAPTDIQTNYEVGQIVFTPGPTAQNLYIYMGAGVWNNFAGSVSPVSVVQGTANQIAVNTVGGTATVSLPSAITAPGSLTTTTSLTATLGNITATNGNLFLGTAGNKLSIATGANASVGTSGALSTGAVTVTTTAVTAGSKIFLTRAVASGTLGNLSVGTITAGTSFTITSDNNADTSTVNWLIIN